MAACTVAAEGPTELAVEPGRDLGSTERRRRWQVAGWAAAVVAGVAISLPAWSVGFLLDDYHHLAILEGADPSSAAGLVDLWSWVDHGTTTMFAADPQGGWLPWYAADDLRIRFLRPLSALLHALDHALYGRWVPGWRFTTLAVWLLLLVAVGRLYVVLGRRDGGPRWVAPLALLLFAVDDCHAWNLGWLATRHGLLAALLAVTTVVLYLEWGEQRRCQLGGLALIAFATALACSENAVAVVAWLVAGEAFLAADKLSARLLRLAPFAAVATTYVLLHRALGYGVRGMSWYVDPVASPLSFIARTWPRRGWALLVGLFTPVPAEAVALGKGWLPVVGAGLLLLALAVVAGLLWRRPVAHCVGAAVCLSLPVAAIPPPLSYLLLLPSVASAWLLASFAGQWLERVGAERAGVGPARSPVCGLTTVAAGVVAVVLAVSHLVLAPVAAVRGILALEDQHRGLLAMVAGAEFDSERASTDTRVVILTSAQPLYTMYLPLCWRVVEVPPQRPVPAAVWVVSSAAGRHRLVRTAERSFDLVFPGGGEEGSLWDAGVREGTGFAPGERYRRGGMMVTVLAAKGGRLQRVAVEIDRSLDAPTVQLLAWDGERLARVAPPAIGQDAAVGPHPLVELLRRRGSS